jgi:hypothetical protein
MLNKMTDIESQKIESYVNKKPLKIWVKLTIGSIDEDLLSVPQRSFLSKSVCFGLSSDKKTYTMTCYFDQMSYDFRKELELNYSIRSFVTLFVPNTNFDEVSFIDNCILHISNIGDETIIKNKTSFAFNPQLEDLQVIDVSYGIKKIKFKKVLEYISYSIPSEIMLRKHADCMEFCGIMKH